MEDNVKKVSRRLFMGVTGASVVSWQLIGCDDDKKTPLVDAGPDGGAGICAVDGETPPAWEDNTHVKFGAVSTTICPYCGCGCGAIVTTAGEGADAVVVNIEGDPDHPVNRGALCSKGQSLYQIRNNETGFRLTTPRVRRAGATEWEEVDWPTAISEIAAKVRTTRDATFETTDTGGQTVNRTTGIASLGGAALDTEECYLIVKAMRAMGLVYIEHQARI